MKRATKTIKKAMALTIVPAGITSEPGKLDTPTLAQVHRRLTDLLAKAKVTTAICVLEIVLIEHENGRYKPAWIWHGHGLGFTGHPERMAKRLSNVFLRTDIIPRPVRVVPWNGGSGWLRYCYKLERRCRIGIDDVRHFDIRKKAERKCRGTKPRTLTPDERLELLLFHDRSSLDGRLITKGAQLRLTRRGCRIVKMRRPRR